MVSKGASASNFFGGVGLSGVWDGLVDGEGNLFVDEDGSVVGDSFPPCKGCVAFFVIDDFEEFGEFDLVCFFVVGDLFAEPDPSWISRMIRAATSCISWAKLLSCK